jgi:hypothetical protein
MWLFSSILLGTNVCCSICDIGIPMKGQCVCIKLGCVWVTGAETYELLEVTVGVLAMERTQVFCMVLQVPMGCDPC